MLDALFSFGHSMRVRPLLLAATLALPGLAAAQPTAAAAPATCIAQTTALQEAIDQARDRGQMLRRRQLAQELAALQARCQDAVPGESRAARITRLEQEIRDLRKALESAETQLRQTRSEAP